MTTSNHALLAIWQIIFKPFAQIYFTWYTLVFSGILVQKRDPTADCSKFVVRKFFFLEHPIVDTPPTRTSSSAWHLALLASRNDTVTEYNWYSHCMSIFTSADKNTILEIISLFHYFIANTSYIMKWCINKLSPKNMANCGDVFVLWNFHRFRINRIFFRIRFSEISMYNPNRENDADFFTFRHFKNRLKRRRLDLRCVKQLVYWARKTLILFCRLWGYLPTPAV